MDLFRIQDFGTNPEESLNILFCVRFGRTLIKQKRGKHPTLAKVDGFPFFGLHCRV